MRLSTFVTVMATPSFANGSVIQNNQRFRVDKISLSKRANFVLKSSPQYDSSYSEKLLSIEARSAKFSSRKTKTKDALWQALQNASTKAISMIKSDLFLINCESTSYSTAGYFFTKIVLEKEALAPYAKPIVFSSVIAGLYFTEERKKKYEPIIKQMKLLKNQLDITRQLEESKNKNATDKALELNKFSVAKPNLEIVYFLISGSISSLFEHLAKLITEKFIVQILAMYVPGLFLSFCIGKQYKAFNKQYKKYQSLTEQDGDAPQNDSSAEFATSGKDLSSFDLSEEGRAKFMGDENS